MNGRIVSADAWRAARVELLAAEKDFTRARDALSARRRRLPWVAVDKRYTFEGPDGPLALIDLFGEASQLIVMHFMFGPDWAEGCTACSFWADGYSGLETHLAHRDTSFVAVSNTGIDKITDYRTRLGWTFPWVSSLGSDFNRDFGVGFTPQEIADGTGDYNYGTNRAPMTETPGLSVFHRPDGGDSIVLTYATFARGLDMMNAAYQLLDLTPKGRDEDDLDFTMAWLRRRDQY